jgi:succinate dehydrogenase/fumarate reductase flavoprotein subunit
MANRVWAGVLLGRGIVHPVDALCGNPPANRQLLSLLAEGWRAAQAAAAVARDRPRGRTSGHSMRAAEIINFADIAARLERLTRDKGSRNAAAGRIAKAKLTSSGARRR